MVQVTFNGDPITLVGTEINIGDEAPNFSALSTDMQAVSLTDYEDKVKLISVVPSVDTGVCAKQTKRFNEEANQLGNVQILTISMDLPFAQKRWTESNDVHSLQILSDHRDADFGKKYGVLIKELRLLSRAVFVVDANNKVTYVQYVSEVTDHPDYDQVLDHLKQIM
ncbi:thiol peroxidase [Virgibacillus sp. W0430]|uniref:thiol peroxidase n=1 Tax=Virgibacillus sp. W0430 TaxID=3391580 RepID=UPI003F472DB5